MNTQNCSKCNDQSRTKLILIFIMLAALLTLPLATVSGSLNETMLNIAKTMDPLFPLIFNKKKFEDPKNLNTIRKSTDQLSKLFGSAKPHFQEKSLTYRISFDVIDDQLKDVKSAIKHKNLNYARNILKEFVSICTSCHTQDTKLRTLFSGVDRSHFDNDLQYAEFNYMTRDYDSAIKNYEAFLTGKNKMSEEFLLRAIKRFVTIYVQIDNDPSKAREILVKYQNHPAHTKYSKATITSWIEGLKELEDKKAGKTTLKTFDKLSAQIKDILGPLKAAGTADFPGKKEKIARVWLRGQLYHYLNSQPPKEEIPQILYWLAIIDRSLDYSFYYSLADNYLKECILSYSSHPYAQKCYDEYETYITFSFSGSRGTDIPDDVKEELEYLKNHLTSSKIPT